MRTNPTPRAVVLMAVLCAGLLCAVHGAARAQLLQLTVSEGATTYLITDNGPLDTNPAIGSIQGLAAALIFPDFHITSISAASNSPGSPAVADLFASGDVTSLNGAPSTLTITTTDVGYMQPTGGPGLLTSITGATFTNAPPGSSQSSQSWFNPSNTLYAKGVPSPSSTLLSSGTPVNGTSASTTAPITIVNPFGLTNEAIITLFEPQSEVSFANLTTVTPRTSSVPEPSALAMLMASPIGCFVALRRRRR